ncbi:hypothetical protein LguiB_028523 [Lonicera macranthoides]
MAVLGFARKLLELIRLSLFPLGITLGHLNSLHSCLGTCYSLFSSALGVVCGVFLVSGLGMDIELFFEPSSCTFPLSTFYISCIQLQFLNHFRPVKWLSNTEIQCNAFFSCLN